MSVIKAIVVDIDGTLTDMQRHISTDAIQAIREMPIPVVLASGNVICFMRAASKLIGASEAMIGETGGVIQSGYDSSPVVLADIEECRRAAAMLKEYFPGMEQLDARYRMSELAFRRNIDVAAAGKLLEEKYPGLEILDTMFALHLKQKSVNKGTGMVKIAGLMGLRPENFAAMGDSWNDLPMFRAASVGIAVGNAVPELKAMATHVTMKSYGEGAAEGFRWLKQRL